MAEATKEGVDATGKAPEAVKVDERGVPWENRAKEYERKLAETNEKLAQLESRLSAVPEKVQQEAVDPAQADEARRARLMAFVEDPDGFIASHTAAREAEKELPEAQKWIRTQPGYSAEDDAKILHIVNENGLNGSPMSRAKSAWKILRAEKMEAEFQKVSDTNKRQSASGEADGAGRAVDASAKPRRADLLAKLAAADKSGDRQTVLDMIGQLEDTRQ